VELRVEGTSKAAGAIVAEMIADAIRVNSEVNLSLPTGSTPEEALAELVRLHHSEGLDFSGANFFNMDEYVGLAKTHEQSYYHFLNERLYSRVNIRPAATFAPDAVADDLASAASAYTDLVYGKGGFDLIFLGIGRDGHISFNMPADALRPYTHIEQLTEATIADNARFFANPAEVPTQAITIGLKMILDSRKVVLLATGDSKSEVVADWLNNDQITTSLPASFLWLHDDVTVILDEAAAARLDRSRYPQLSQASN